MIRLADLPVAARVERGWVQPTLVEEVGPDTPHRLRLAGDPDLPTSIRQLRTPDGCFEQRTRRCSLDAAVAKMEPVERDPRRAVQGLLLVTVLNLDEDVGASAR